MNTVDAAINAIRKMLQNYGFRGPGGPGSTDSPQGPNDPNTWQ